MSKTLKAGAGILGLLLVLGISSGCTADDKDYIRQHIVHNEVPVVQKLSLNHSVGIERNLEKIQN